MTLSLSYGTKYFHKLRDRLGSWRCTLGRLTHGKKGEEKSKLNCRGDTDSEITVEAGFVCSQTATTDVPRAEISETFCIIHRGTGLLVDI